MFVFIKENISEIERQRERAVLSTLSRIVGTIFKLNFRKFRNMLKINQFRVE